VGLNDWKAQSSRLNFNIISLYFDRLNGNKCIILLTYKNSHTAYRSVVLIPLKEKYLSLVDLIPLVPIAIFFYYLFVLYYLILHLLLFLIVI